MFQPFQMYFTDEELQKQKGQDLRQHPLQRVVPIGNNARKFN